MLFFALNKPEKCRAVVPFKVMLKQRTNLIQWNNISKAIAITDKSQAIDSKRKLKQDFEQTIKPKIILEIQKSNTQEINS